MKYSKLRFLSGVVLALTCITVSAADIKWSSHPYTLYSKQDSLRDILTGLAASESIPVEVSESVQDVISANFENMTRKAIFQQLVEAYGLAWYYDGHRLYIDRLENTQAATIRLRSLSVAAFRAHLNKLGVIDDDYRYGWQSIDHKKLIYISGPAPFVERVTQMAKILDDSSRSVETIYKWTDKAGVTHYSSDAAEAPNRAKIIEVQAGGGGAFSAFPSAQMQMEQADQALNSVNKSSAAPAAANEAPKPVAFGASSSFQNNSQNNTRIPQ